MGTVSGRSNLGGKRLWFAHETPEGAERRISAGPEVLSTASTTRLGVQDPISVVDALARFNHPCGWIRLVWGVARVW